MLNQPRQCELCGADLPANAPQGLCPRCLANMGLNALSSPEPSFSDVRMERPGTVIGRYKLLEKIGEGGFGVVYMAEQVEPIQRKVALKIIKAGMDTREVIARFEAERQAIALMDHPNIARALDAGATEAGRPYFVMELVRGIPVTEYCDQNELSTRARLGLFIKVCQAVQHAHQKGVIHRDLKPSNVLVTEHDGEPVPKVIDFGVAKALGQKLTGKTFFTAFHHLIGTPAYMSPEQAALSGIDVDTRADIYSLGVLLYELLTGVTPFDAETFRKAGIDEIRRMIQETEPPKPSTRLQTLGQTLKKVAKYRQTEPATLSKLVRGDLDWIVMKCLEKDRSRRYATANGLAADVDRHLSSEPVVARPPSAAYRFQKLVRRHKLGFAAVSAVSASLVLGLGIATWSLAKERQARELADAALQEQERLRQAADADRKMAEIEANRSRHVAQYLKNILDDLAPSLAKGCTKKYAETVLSRVDERVGNELQDQPDVEAVVRSSLAEIQAGLGQYAGAETNLNQALVLRRKAFGDSHAEVAATIAKLAELYRNQKKWEQAETLARQVVAYWQKSVTANPANQQARVELGHSQWQLAYVLVESGQRDAATGVLNNALKTFQTATTDFPANPYFRQEQAFTRRTMGDWFNDLGQVDEMASSYRTAIELYAGLKAEFPEDAFYRSEEGYTSWMLAGKLQGAKKFQEAEADYRRAIALHQEALARFPEDDELRSRLDSIRNDLISLLDLQGKLSEVRTLLDAQLRDARNWELADASSSLGAATNVLPLVMMQDVPLPVAIRNLAAQAELNYSLDPEVEKRLEGTNETSVARPTVSIRWENLTALQALKAILTNYNLAILHDSRTPTIRIVTSGAAERETRNLEPKQFVGKPFPGSFTLPILDGGEIILPDPKGTNVLLLDFCATWCPPCRQAMPVLEKISEDYSTQGVSFIEVNAWGEDPDRTRRYFAESGLHTKMALDRGDRMVGAFRIKAIPTILIVDRSNIIRYVRVGYSPGAGVEIREALDEVLNPGLNSQAMRPGSPIPSHASIRPMFTTDADLLRSVLAETTQALRQEPANHLHYYLAAPLRLLTGDEAGYEVVCQAMVSRFGDTTDPVLAERTSKTCLLVADPKANLRIACKLADITISNSATNDDDRAYFQFVKALAEYRLGKPDAVIEWTTRSLTQGAPWAAPYNSSREIMTYALRAMAFHALHKASESEAALKTATDMMQRDAPKNLNSVGGTLLVDWMTCQVFLDEAEALVGEEPRATGVH